MRIGGTDHNRKTAGLNRGHDRILGIFHPGRHNGALTVPEKDTNGYPFSSLQMVATDHLAAVEFYPPIGD
jgi:hypothetical protein